MSFARNVSHTLATLLLACEEKIHNVVVRMMPRPQAPRKRSYVVRKVDFPGGEHGVTLAGELTMPSEGGPFPAMVLISWGSASDRNLSFGGHKPFLVLSDHLTRRGYAVLRYDGRGAGESADEITSATAMDLAGDAATALRWLRAHPEVDASRAGYVGHSQGGCFASLAAPMERPDFMVLLATRSQPFSDVALLQEAEIGRASGMTDAEISETQLQMTQFLEILRNSTTPDEAREPIVAHLREVGASEYQIRTCLDQWANHWGLWAIDFDPLPALSAYDGPVLALYGGMDLQVSAAANAPKMKSALTHAASEVLIQPTLNHMFQPTNTGLTEDCWKSWTTFDEGTMTAIADWLDRTLR